MSGTDCLRLRLPGARTPVVILLKKPLPALSAKEALHRLASQLRIPDPKAYALVISPSPAHPAGFLVQDDTPIGAHGIEQYSYIYICLKRY